MAKSFTLSDGRNIDYLVSGAEDGFPLLWIYGTPSAYQLAPGFADACTKKGIKVISLSRAGYGGSTRNKGRRVVDAVADIQALLAHLGVMGKFCVIGWSGGGPHALACAARLSGCVAVLCIASFAPYGAEGLNFLGGMGEKNVQGWNAALEGEEELLKFLEPMRLWMVTSDAASVTDSLSTGFPDVDKEALLGNGKEMGLNLIDSLQEGLKYNCDGWVDDDMAFVSPWGFDLGEITVPIFLYHGELDSTVPFAHGEWLAKHLPQGKLKKYLLPGQGHISIFIARRDSMIDELLETGKL
ncbi:MAG: hypothetical protein Q9160_009313 [Pyrenula sp. 1 TL-2023]